MRDRSVVSSFIIRRRVARPPRLPSSPPPPPSSESNKAAATAPNVSPTTTSLTSSELLLLKRSDKVRTHPNKWAAVSGAIDTSDPTPQFAAAREIQEETGLLETSDIKLIRKGDPLVIEDEVHSTRWTIHPFLWELLLRDNKPGKIEEEEKIQIDWEHSEYQWFDVERDVLENTKFEEEIGETVPKLLKTFRSVWVEE